MRMCSDDKVCAVVGEELGPLLLLIGGFKHVLGAPVRIHDDKVSLFAGFFHVLCYLSLVSIVHKVHKIRLVSRE